MCIHLSKLIVVVQFLLLIQISSQDVSQANDSASNVDLVKVSVIYRHGDRAPFQPYPKDPYRDPKYWPMGYEQLTNIGKMQEYQLGQFLRNRYDYFLSAEYNRTEIYVRSTDVDRTLMSAESSLAGLYPPKPDQEWNPNLSWQPIPVHTLPVSHDYLLAMKKPCEKYMQLYEALMHSTEFQEINHQNQKLYMYLTKNTGQTINDLSSLQGLHNTLFIERLYNLTLPEWTKSVYSQLQKWADFSFSLYTYTKELAQLRTGPLLNEIANHFENTSDFTKFFMYSAHDTTVADILNSLGLFEYHSPPYSSTVFFELRHRNSSYFVNILYKNSTVPQRMVLKGCSFDCPFDDFLKILAPLRLTHDEWEFACQPKFLGVMPFNTLQSGIFTGCMGLLFILLCSFVVSLFCARRRRRMNVDYTRLPDEEVS